MFHVKQNAMNSIEPTVEQRKLLDFHLQLVIENNKLTNITNITDWESGQLLHIEDSLVGIPEINAAPDGRYGDIGTGAGFPGIPAAITTGRETVLIDSVGKKTRVLDSIIKELGIDDRVSTYTGRLEELALEQPESFSVLSARALSSLPSLLELAAPLLKLGGHLVCYKAKPSEEELQTAVDLETKLGMKQLSSRHLVLSDGETERTIIVFEKVAQPTVKLPRRPGMAQKRPYKA